MSSVGPRSVAFCCSPCTSFALFQAQKSPDLTTLLPAASGACRQIRAGLTFCRSDVGCADKLSIQPDVMRTVAAHGVEVKIALSIWYIGRREVNAQHPQESQSKSNGQGS